VIRSGGGTGTVTSDPAGIDCGTDCEGLFPLENPVQLTAEPAKGSRFAGWTGACSGTGTCSPVASGDGLPVEVGAVFVKQRRPVARVRGRATPRLIRLRLGCGEPVACRLEVKVVLSVPKEARGYRYWNKRKMAEVQVEAAGHRFVNLRPGPAGRRMLRVMAKYARTSGTIRVTVRNIDTGTWVAINDKYPCVKCRQKQE
jgi:hypothetical protein